MVAILVVLTITVLLLTDWSLQLVQAKRAKNRAAARNPHVGAPLASNPFSPPRGLFFHPSHAWAHVEPNGDVKIGLDGLVGFLLGKIDRVDLPIPGKAVREGESLATIYQGDRKLELRSPVEGEVVIVNRELMPDGHFIRCEPYGAGWVCQIKPKSLAGNLHELMVGEDVTKWHANEARRIIKFLSHAQANNNVEVPESLPSDGLLLRGFMEGASDDEWRRFQSQFLDARAEG